MPRCRLRGLSGWRAAVAMPRRRGLPAQKRLRARSEDSDEVIERRLRGAAGEIRRYHEYDYVIVNRDVEEATGNLAAIFKAERRRLAKKEDEIRSILETFENVSPE